MIFDITNSLVLFLIFLSLCILIKAINEYKKQQLEIFQTFSRLFINFHDTVSAELHLIRECNILDTKLKLSDATIVIEPERELKTLNIPDTETIIQVLSTKDKQNITLSVK